MLWCKYTENVGDIQLNLNIIFGVNTLKTLVTYSPRIKGVSMYFGVDSMKTWVDIIS